MTIADVSALLERHEFRHAVIGATALAVHGVTRSSEDVDFLVTDLRCSEADGRMGSSPGRGRRRFGAPKCRS